MTGRALRWAWAVLRPRGREAAGECRVVALRHHRVYDDGADPLYRLGVSRRVLEAQLRWLACHARVVTMAEAVRRLGARDPGRWLAVTFDDGYADNVTRALPLLRAAGIPATFFLTAGLIEARGTFWWDEAAFALERTGRAAFAWEGASLPCATRLEKRRALRRLLPGFRVGPEERRARLEALARALGVEERAPCELMDWEGARALRDAGMELGAHTLSHPHLSLLAPEAQAREVAGSARLVAERIGVEVAGLAYPGGDHDERTVAAVRAAGLRYAVTTEAGDNRPGADPFRLRRRPAGDGACLSPAGGFSAALLDAELEGAFDAVRGSRRSA